MSAIDSQRNRLRHDLVTFCQNIGYQCQKVRSDKPEKLLKKKSHKWTLPLRKDEFYFNLDDDHEFDDIMENARRKLQN